MMRLLAGGLLSIVLLLNVTFDVAAAEERLIAVILINNQPRYQAIHEEFKQQLARHTTQNYRLYIQKPNADIMSLRNSARKAVALGADVIVTYGAAATLAAQAETDGVPVLFADVYDPVKLKLVAKDGSAVRHTVGVRGDGPIQTLLNVLKQTTHGSEFGVLFNPRDPAGMAQAEAVVEMGGRRGFKTTKLAIKSSSELQRVLSNVPATVKGLLVTDSVVLANQQENIISIGEQANLPLVSQIPGFADIGGFLALENDPVEQAEVLATMTGQVLDGVSLDKLHMAKPHNISLTINLKVAERLGIRVPFEILAMMTRVIR